MATQAQLEANRQNAQKSTGPRTEAGKAKSSQNALTHGLIDETQRQTIRQRKAMLDAWSELLIAMIGQGQSEREATAAFIQRQGGGISRASLYRWRAGWREAGWAGLLDGRRDREGEAEGGEFIEELKRLYLSPRQRGVSLCSSIAVDKAEKGGWVTPCSGAKGGRRRST